jgi:hypothetical protein
VLQLLVTANVVPSSLILSIQLMFLRSVIQLLVTANVVPSSRILSIQLVFLRSVLQLLVTANVVPSSLSLSIQLVFLRSVLQLLVTANVVPSTLILSILNMETTRSSETSCLTRPTRRHIPEDDILRLSHCPSLELMCCLTPFSEISWGHLNSAR